MNSSFKDLMISVSGIRGKVGDGLSLDAIVKFSHSFGTYFKGSSVVLGRDTRPSGFFINSILQGVFSALNKDVLSVGVVPTPTLKSIIREKSDSGIMISASHNPVEWNAFKFINQDGFFLGQDDITAILKIIETNSYDKLTFKPTSKVVEERSLSEIHLHSVLKQAKVESIFKKKFHIFLDTFNGAGSEIIPELLNRLNCKSFLYRADINGEFPLHSEPNEENLKETSKAILDSNVHIGFATDPDADRLVVLTPRRGAISEEYTFALCLYSKMMDGVKGNFVTNLSTSFISEEIASKFTATSVRSKVGEANVVDMMLEKDSFLGGEGNGGVIDPSVSSYGRDSLIGIVHILNLLVMTNQSIDDILDNFPQIFINKRIYKYDPNLSLEELFNKFSAAFPKHKVDKRDGLHFSNDFEWVQIRSSNTEPILRVMYEAKTKDDLEKLSKKISLLMD